jgi:predicted MFS family arabinose efflux permease
VARLLALAGATFVYVTFEVFPVGLIRDIAADVDVGEGQVGLLVSGYAVVAAVATIPTVALTSRMSRRQALVGALLFLVAAELLTAVSTSFAMLAVSRFIAALTHGVVWSLVAPAAATLVPRERVGTATAVVFGGASLALVLGSPGTTFVGGLIGWLETVVVLTGATVLVTGALLRSLRSAREEPSAPPSDVRSSRAGVRWRAVVLLCGISVLLVTAHFISYTYIAVIVTEVTGTAGLVVAVLTLFGLAGAVGTVIIGGLIDHGARRAELVTMSSFAAGLLILALATLPLSPGLRYAGVFVAVAVWGIAFAATGPVFQTGVMRIADGDADRASSVYVTGVQVGIAAGSAVGATFSPGRSHGFRWCRRYWLWLSWRWWWCAVRRRREDYREGYPEEWFRYTILA